VEQCAAQSSALYQKQEFLPITQLYLYSQIQARKYLTELLLPFHLMMVVAPNKYRENLPLSHIGL